jgi:hypothetical protein
MSLRILLASVILLGACGDDGPVTVPDAGDPELPWWTPEPAEYRNWDVQLYDKSGAQPFDITATRDMYVLDLFEVISGPTTLDYAGTQVTFPAGKLPTAIADLHGRSTIVVCRVNVGAIRPGDPDFEQYPVAIRGGSTNNDNAADEIFVDIRMGMRPMWATALQRRIELAKMVGCDAIDADKSLQSSGVGLDVSFDEQRAFHIAVADIAHRADLQLSVGLRNGLGQLTSDPSVLDAYDFTIAEGMVPGNCCDEVRTFVDARKAAFALDYLSAVTTIESACLEYANKNMRDGILKDDALSSATRESCP